VSGLARQPWILATGLVVPLLVLAAPPPLQLAGVPPSWAVLWLLPWALMDGPLSGALLGVVLGLLLDSLHPGPLTQLPVLVLLGWWWGRLGRRRAPIERSFSLGLLALLGTALLGASLALQQLAWGLSSSAVVHTLLAQTLLTGLLAPMLCSLQLLLWRQLVPGLRR
jgi:rod shape-determining protein MreD